MKFFFYYMFLLCAFYNLNGFSQVGIGTANPSKASMLEIASDTAGFLPPRLTQTQMNALSARAIAGLFIYNKTVNSFYVYNGTAWQKILSSGNFQESGWSLNGNTGLSATANFLGTSDTSRLRFRVNNAASGIIDWYTNNTSLGYNTLVSNKGIQNTAFGSIALFTNTLGNNNTGIGFSSLYFNKLGGQNTGIGVNALRQNQNGNNSTAIGYQALYNDTTGNNTAIGESSLYWNKSGTANVAIGNSALQDNQAGSNNTAIGYWSLFSSNANDNTAIGSFSMNSTTTGTSNVAIGSGALQTNSAGSSNTAVGFLSLNQNAAGENTAIGSFSMNGNTSGTANVAMGTSALQGNQSGSNLTAIGYMALNQNQSSENTAVGYRSLLNNQTGTANVAIGNNALAANITGNNNTAIGWESLGSGTGANNTMIGASTGFFGGNFSNSVAVGYNTKVTASNQVRLGDNNISSFFCKGAYNGTTSGVSPNLYVNESGQIMRITSKNDNLPEPAVNDLPENRFSIKPEFSNLGPGESGKIVIPAEGITEEYVVVASPRSELPDGLTIAYARVSGSDLIEVKMLNCSNITISTTDMEIIVKAIK